MNEIAVEHGGECVSVCVSVSGREETKTSLGEGEEMATNLLGLFATKQSQLKGILRDVIGVTYIVMQR